MTPPRPTELVHTLLADAIQPGDSVIDATCGNGHDTIFLARRVGANGRVLAFDVQQAAIEATRRSLQELDLHERVELHQQSHRRMADHAQPESITAVTFNLGYLPGEDHGVTTETLETLKALEAARNVLKRGGLLSVVCYPGHETGRDEAAKVEEWLTSLTSLRWRIAKYAMLGTLKPAPFLLLAHKP